MRCKWSHEYQTSTGAHNFYNQPTQNINPYGFSDIQASNSDSNISRGKGTKTCPQFYTLDSAPSLYGSPLAASISDETNVLQPLRALKNEFLSPESDVDYSGSFSSPFTTYDTIQKMAPHMDLIQLLTACAEIISEADNLSFPKEKLAISASKALMDVLEKRVSESGEPLQRLGAYVLEGLRARLLSSGNIIYKKLKCKEPRGSELMSYMQVLSQICPYYKFAYLSANVMIAEAMENESRIHIIDFQIAQGSQWVPFIQTLSRRPGGPPFLRITGIDDPQSAYARGGGLRSVGERLSQEAESCGVPFDFRGEVQPSNLKVQYGEALAVNFPYVLHHVPDESVSTTNERDRLLRLVKSLSPKIMTLVEQESNTNTAGFVRRFRETVDYYGAMFESIDAAARPRDDRVRVSAEEHCVARDVVNIIACEGGERVERHELFGKWRLRLTMAGFNPVRLSSSVSGTRLRKC
ncbi:GRAS [Castilleja foliolosa]|uniref:GRAS n=1 Tax=Castilleja foliolosa TaxID=1961234 RepID=A0ABD3C7B5_9LAMI